MVERVALHILDDDESRRAALARLALDAGHSAEVYASASEIFARAPTSGVVLAHDNFPGDELACIIGAFTRRVDKWLPVIAFATFPQTTAIVRAIKAGASDYITLPKHIDPLNESIEHALCEATAQLSFNSLAISARKRVAFLSGREREVLERIAGGASNKIIARELGLSPRTVEVHRMKMMGKLGAHHSAEVVRIWLEAQGKQTA